MGQVYELGIEKKDGNTEVLYIASEGVFAPHGLGKLEKIFDPMFYSWNIREKGNVYLRNITGDTLVQIQRKITEAK